MTAERRLGLRLFREACVSCHELARPEKSQAIWAARHDGEDEAEEYGEYRDDEHDRPPALVDPTPLEALGEQLYRVNRAHCHAMDGTGRNWIGRFLEPHPPDFTDTRYTGSISRGYLMESILEGRVETSMPAFKFVLDGDESAAIVVYMGRLFFDRPID